MSMHFKYNNMFRVTTNGFLDPDSRNIPVFRFVPTKNCRAEMARHNLTLTKTGGGVQVNYKTNELEVGNARILSPLTEEITFHFNLYLTDKSYLDRYKVSFPVAVDGIPPANPFGPNFYLDNLSESSIRGSGSITSIDYLSDKDNADFKFSGEKGRIDVYQSEDLVHKVMADDSTDIPMPFGIMAIYMGPDELEIVRPEYSYNINLQ